MNALNLPQGSHGGARSACYVAFGNHWGHGFGEHEP